MLFLAQMSLDRPPQWIQCDAKTNQCVLISEHGEETEIPLKAWPFLVYNFENQRYYCMDNETESTAALEEGILLYKLISLGNSDSRWFDRAQTLDKNKLSPLPFKARPHLIKNQDRLFGLADKLREALSINKEAHEAQYKQLTTHFENLSLSSVSTETHPLKDNTLFLEAVITLSKELYQVLSAQDNVLSLLGHLYVPEDSLQFSAMVLTLLQRYISPEKLLESGILGSFYLMNVSFSEDISNAYKALKTLSDSRPDVFPRAGNNLFTLAKEHYAESIGPTGVYQALDGSVSKSPLKPATNKINLPSPTINSLPKDIQLLANFFKDDFFLICITQASNFSDLKNPLSHYLYDSNNFSLDLAKRLLAYSLQSSAIQNLFSLLSLETLETLLMEPKYTADVLFYLINNKKLFVDINSLTSSFYITTKNFVAWFHLSKHPLLAHVKDRLQEALCCFLLSLSSDDRTYLFHNTVLSILKASSHLSTWAKKQYQRYYAELLKILEEKLTRDTFINAKDHFEQHFSKIQFLEELSPQSDLIYPGSQHAFNGLVITEASKTLEDLPGILGIVFDHFDTNYPSSEDQIIARLRAIAYSSEDIQNHYITLIHQELSEPSLLAKLIFNLVTDSNETKKSVTAFLLKIIEAIQTTHPQNIINALNTGYANDSTVWHFFSKETITAIVSILAKRSENISAIIRGINKPCKLGWTVLDRLFSQEIVSIISALAKNTENIPKLIQSMNEPNKSGKTVWQKLLASGDAITSTITLLATNPENISALIQSMSVINQYGNNFWEELPAKQFVSIISDLIANTEHIPLLIQGINRLDKYGSTLWHKLSDEVITLIVPILAKNLENIPALIEGMNTPNQVGKTVWHKLLASDNAIIAIITLLATNPENINAITQGMIKPDKKGITAWHELSDEQNALITPILGKRPEKPRTLTKGMSTPNKFYNNIFDMFSKKNIELQEKTLAISPATTISMMALKRILSNHNDRPCRDRLFHPPTLPSIRELEKLLTGHDDITWSEIQTVFEHYLLESQQPDNIHVSRRSKLVFDELIPCFLEEQQNKEENSALSLKHGGG